MEFIHPFFPTALFMHASIDSLPLDSLVQILCKLDHTEIKRLLLVSKSFHHAALIARQLHFDFSTPAAAKKMKLPFFSSRKTDTGRETPVLKLECRKVSRKCKLSEEETRRITVVLFPTVECKQGTVDSGGRRKQSLLLSNNC